LDAVKRGISLTIHALQFGLLVGKSHDLIGFSSKVLPFGDIDKYLCSLKKSLYLNSSKKTLKGEHRPPNTGLFMRRILLKISITAPPKRLLFYLTFLRFKS